MKWIVCKQCGYVSESEAVPETCPQCNASSERFFVKQIFKWGDENKRGCAQELSDRVIDMLRVSFNSECVESGLYLAMARQAEREGFPEVGEVYRRVAQEEAEHAARIAELLGEHVFSNTKLNLDMRVNAESSNTRYKTQLAQLAREEGGNEVADAIGEMCRDEARHGEMFRGLLERFFS